MRLKFDSLAGSTGEFGHQRVVFCCPRGHVSRWKTGVLVGSLLFERILGVVLPLLIVVALVILLIASEDFWVLREVLLVRSPFLVPVSVRSLIHIDIVFNLASVVVVDSMLDVLKVFVRRWHAHFTELVLEFVLQILPSVLLDLITMVELLSKGLACVLLVNLRHLLHLKLVLSHQVLLLLSEITKISGWSSGEDLPRWNSCSLRNHSACRNNGKWLNSGSSSNRCSHSYESVVFNRACIHADIGTNIAVLTDLYLIAWSSLTAGNSGQVLNRRVLSD